MQLCWAVNKVLKYWFKQEEVLQIKVKLMWRLLALRAWFFPQCPASECVSLPHLTHLYLSVFFVEMPRCILLILFLSTLKLATGSAFSVKKKKNKRWCVASFFYLNILIWLILELLKVWKCFMFHHYHNNIVTFYLIILLFN